MSTSKAKLKAKPNGETKDQKTEPKAKTNPGQVPSKEQANIHGMVQAKVQAKDKQICWRGPELKSKTMLEPRAKPPTKPLP
jgi:hypothetical protein